MSDRTRAVDRARARRVRRGARLGGRADHRPWATASSRCRTRGLSGAELEQRLRAMVEEIGREGGVHGPAGGQLHHGRASACCATASVVVVSGVNLPTLLDFVLAPAAVAARSRRRRRSSAARRRSGARSGRHVAIELYRIDDRLIHGQVVVGWGQPLDLGFHRARRRRSRAQRVGAGALSHGRAAGDGCVLRIRRGRDARGSINWNSGQAPGNPADRTSRRWRGSSAAKQSTIRAVNLGGIHHRAGRVQRLRYVFLTGDEERALRELDARGVEVTAQDVPASRRFRSSELLEGTEGGRRMTITTILLFALLGALLGLDVVSFPQAMISRPLVAVDARRRACRQAPATDCSSARRSS